MVTIELFKTTQDAQDWIEQQQDYVLLSEQTPLLSNLLIWENIALIEQSHHRLSVKESQRHVQALLDKVGQGHLAKKRIYECNELELFIALLARSYFMDVAQLVIVYPEALVGNTVNFSDVRYWIERIETKKTVVILDLIYNQGYFQGQTCHINA